MTLSLKLFCMIFTSLFLFSPDSWSQTKSQNTFVSVTDKSLTVRTIVVAPVEDNVSGIYAQPVESHIKEVLAQDPQWTPSEFKNFEGFKTSSLYTLPREVIRLAKTAEADAVLKIKLSKGPSGLNGKLTLFSGLDGLPLVEENIENSQRFEVNDVKNIFANALKGLRNRLPYRAEVLSRRGQEITFNAGKSFNIKTGTDISIIQILKLHRHPKLNFIVASEKEILGKARVYKVDDTLSFARIVMEREPGVIQVGAKILPDEYVQYSEPYITEDGQVLSDLDKRKDKDVAYGEKPAEWLPDHPAQYGRLQLLGGITQYTQTAAFVNSGSVDGTNNMAPTIGLGGEFWISHLIYAGLDLRSSAFSVSNNLTGSSPDKINMTLNYYDAHVGYNFLLSPDFFGPKVQISGGLAKFSAHATETSPITFTNMDYGGLMVSFAGMFPVGEETPTDIGARFKYYWNPTVNENRSSGSSGDIKINDFSFFFNYHAKPKFSYIGQLSFEYYTADFSGAGNRPEEVTSISHKSTIMMFGVEFLY